MQALILRDFVRRYVMCCSRERVLCGASVSFFLVVSLCV